MHLAFLVAEPSNAKYEIDPKVRANIQKAEAK